MSTETILDYTREAAPALANHARARDVLEQAGVDAIVATSPENVAYLSGYACHTHWSQRGTLVFCLYQPDAPPLVVAPAFELDAWAERPPREGEIRLHGMSLQAVGREADVDAAARHLDDQLIYDIGFADERHEDAPTVLAAALRERGLEGARIALDETRLTYPARARVVEALGRASVSDAGALLHRIRMVKTEAEIERLESAAQLASRALASTMAQVQAGVTEKELYDHYNSFVAAAGGKPTFAAINAGRRSGHPHPIPSDYVIKEGDVVKYDVGCSVDFYQADIGHTQFVGDVDQADADLYHALLVGEQEGIAALRPGARPSEVFDAAVEAVRANGLPGYRRHHVGHGIGIEVYDPPLIAPASASSPSGMQASDDAIEEGMVINIETPYYVLGRHGMIVEDTVVLTADGPRYLSEIDRSL